MGSLSLDSFGIAAGRTPGIDPAHVLPAVRAICASATRQDDPKTDALELLGMCGLLPEITP